MRIEYIRGTGTIVRGGRRYHRAWRTIGTCKQCGKVRLVLKYRDLACRDCYRKLWR